jgi:pimeloyl-ACP methyl ester carboxylesterase
MTASARVAGGAALALTGIAWARYPRDLQCDYERLAAFEPTVLDTPFGRVEYAQAGTGPPVLVVHGVFGGFDFGVGVGRVNVPPGYRIISPSRFGFMGAPLPADPSPTAQADAFAALLDHLEIAELPVIAFSAGSSSAVQLALRHPQRVSRLVLISPNSPHPDPLPKPPRLLAPIIFSQPVFWAMRLLARSRLEGISGTPAGFVPDDGYVGNADIASYPFESMTVPTLVIAAEDDTLAPYNDSRAMAERIPGAHFVSVHRGGHTLTQLDPGARPAVAEFIAAGTGGTICDLVESRALETGAERSRTAAVDLYWIPLGAGGHSVRFNGKVFEAIDAVRQHRPRCDLYHAALIVEVDGDRYTIEIAPSPNSDTLTRGVVATGAVGSRYIGWLRLFRYEVRRWRGGSIPDLHWAVGGPVRISSDPRVARRLLNLVPTVPTPVWGRDELKTGEMWNSNSLVAWLIATAGLPTDVLWPPLRGRAPGWGSGLEVARRNGAYERQPRVYRDFDVEELQQFAGVCQLAHGHRRSPPPSDVFRSGEGTAELAGPLSWLILRICLSNTVEGA